MQTPKQFSDGGSKDTNLWNNVSDQQQSQDVQARTHRGAKGCWLAVWQIGNHGCYENPGQRWLVALSLATVAESYTEGPDGAAVGGESCRSQHSIHYSKNRTEGWCLCENDDCTKSLFKQSWNIMTAFKVLHKSDSYKTATSLELGAAQRSFILSRTVPLIVSTQLCISSIPDNPSVWMCNLPFKKHGKTKCSPCRPCSPSPAVTLNFSANCSADS